jgi:hypothetical protein
LFPFPSSSVSTYLKVLVLVFLIVSIGVFLSPRCENWLKTQELQTQLRESNVNECK